MRISLYHRGLNFAQAAAASIQGSRGSVARFNLIDGLAVGFGLSDAETLAILVQSGWNDRCLPPWPIRDLESAIPRIRRDSRKPSGYLLVNNGAGAAPHSPKPQPIVQDLPAAKPRTWPKFHSLSTPTLAEFANLRRLPVEGVGIARSLKVLSGAMVPDVNGPRRCVIIHEGDFAQARALDGCPFTFRDGTAAKAKTLPGSTGNGFVGKRTVNEDSPVLLLEGAVAFVEGCAAAFLAGETTYVWGILAAVSSGSRFANDLELLEKLRNHRVRIVLDNDPAGAAAAGKWTAELRSVGCAVDAVRLPRPAKDIGDVIAANTTESREVLKSIFTL